MFYGFHSCSFMGQHAKEVFKVWIMLYNFTSAQAASVLFLHDLHDLTEVTFCPTVKSHLADTFLGKSVAKVTPSHQYLLWQLQTQRFSTLQLALFTLSRKLSFVTEEQQLLLSRPKEWEICCNWSGQMEIGWWQMEMFASDKLQKCSCSHCRSIFLWTICLTHHRVWLVHQTFLSAASDS